MGLFSDECWQCACKVKKGLAYCPQCGAPAGGARFECPRCHGHNQGPARHCTHCSAALFDESGRLIERPCLVENVWRREPDDLAVRLHVQDVPGLFTKAVVIEEGTAALVFQNGRFAGKLSAGRFVHTTLLESLRAWFNLGSPALFVLVDSADLEMGIGAEALTSEGLPVGIGARIVVRLEDHPLFFQNLMKGRQRVRRGDLEHALEAEVHTAVEHAVSSRSLAELPGNLKLREELLGILARHLSPTLDRYGLQLIHVASVSYESEDLARLTARRRHTFEVTQESRQAIEEAREHADRIRGADVEREAAHVAELTEERRRQELERAQMEGKLNRARQVIAERAVGDDYERESDLKDQEQQIAVFGRKREADLKLWKEAQDAELEAARKKLEVFSGAAAHALAAILDGPAAERVLRLEELRVQERLSPEQMLIFTAGKSPPVAQALAQKYAADGTLRMAQAEKIFAEQKAEMAQEFSEQAMDRMADVAGARAAAAGGVRCPKGHPTFAGDTFCRTCGTALKAVP